MTDGTAATYPSRRTSTTGRTAPARPRPAGRPPPGNRYGSDAVNETLDASRNLLAWTNDHRELLIVAGLGLTVLLLLWTVRRAIRSGRPDKYLARLSFMVGFAWSGEAMWEVATQRLHLSHVFAGFAFFLFESQMATAMMRAERHQERHHHPGKHGRSVWLIAVVAGVIAAMAGDSPVEMVLRLAVPLLVAHQWWVGLTGDGTETPADAITWTWTPRRILVTLGLARPGDHDLKTVDRERHIRAIAAVSHRLHSTSWAWRRTWCHTRLRRLAMHADDEMLDAARARVERVWQAAERTRPVNAADRTARRRCRRGSGSGPGRSGSGARGGSGSQRGGGSCGRPRGSGSKPARHGGGGSGSAAEAGGSGSYWPGAGGSGSGSRASGGPRRGTARVTCAGADRRGVGGLAASG